MDTAVARLDALTATEAVAAMRDGSLRAEDYAIALLERAASLESLNAFRTLERERVLEAARAADKARASGARPGLLHGLPIPVKDSVNTRDLPTTNGTQALRDFRPREDAAVVRLLRAQGAIVMGKTGIHELSRGWTSNNGAFGAVRNPYDPARIPGGSSGGSAAAVASRMAPLAIAEDTLGSIRVPAALCGVAGFRPTFGRYPDAGIMPLTQGKFDQVGPLARNVRDLALFDAAVTGEEGALVARPLEGARLGIGDYFLEGLEAEVERVVNAALERLREAGAVLVPIGITQAIRDTFSVTAAIIGYENRAAIGAFLREHGAGVDFDALLARASPNIQILYKGNPVSREAYEQALAGRERATAEIRALYAGERLDALAFPPVLVPALPLGDNPQVEIRGEKVSLRTVMARNTSPGSCASLASLVLPAGMTEGGLPVGMEFDALPGEDRALLALGLSLERALGPIPAPRFLPRETQMAADQGADGRR